MSVIERIANVLHGVASRGDASPNRATRGAEEDTEAGRDEEQDNELPTNSRSDTGRQTTESPRAEAESTSQLYRCSPCGTTYVSSEMDTCPACDASLDRVPNGRELGIA